MRMRTYASTITLSSSSPGAPDHTSFRGTVSGAPFLPDYNSFSMNVAGDYVAIRFGDLQSDPGIVEQVTANSKPDNSSGRVYFAVGGAAAASVGTAASAISASFDGWIEYCSPKAEMGPHYDCRPGLAAVRAWCDSKNHQLILTPR
jgi:hypothetical protein